MSKFIWKDKEIKTMGETMDAAIQAMQDGEAMAFKQAYIDSFLELGTRDKAEEIVSSNLGYMSGYWVCGVVGGEKVSKEQENLKLVPLAPPLLMGLPP